MTAARILVPAWLKSRRMIAILIAAASLALVAAWRVPVAGEPGIPGGRLWMWQSQPQHYLAASDVTGMLTAIAVPTLLATASPFLEPFRTARLRAAHLLSWLAGLALVLAAMTPALGRLPAEVSPPWYELSNVAVVYGAASLLIALVGRTLGAASTAIGAAAAVVVEQSQGLAVPIAHSEGQPTLIVPLAILAAGAIAQGYVVGQARWIDTFIANEE